MIDTGRDIVSRYVHEYEAAVSATAHILNAKNIDHSGSFI